MTYYIKKYEDYFVALACFIVFSVYSVCVGLYEGRDMWSYATYYNQFFQNNPADVMVQLFRTPVTPFFYGILFDLGGWKMVLMVTGVLFTIGLILVYRCIKEISRILGIVCLILIFIRYRSVDVFFGVASEAVMAIAVIFWFVIAWRALQKNKINWWIYYGFCIVILILIRPGNQVTLIGCLIPWIGKDYTFKEKWRGSLFVLLPSLVVLPLYVGYNKIRFSYGGIAALGNAHLPFYRVYTQEALIRPEYGPASRRLQEIIQEKILTKPVFRNFEIKESDIFELSTSRMYQHIVEEVYKTEGWVADGRLLRDVAWELALKNPSDFWRSYIHQMKIGFEFPKKWIIDKRKPLIQQINQEHAKRKILWKAKGFDEKYWSDDDLLPENHGSNWLMLRPPNYRINSEKWIFKNFKHSEWKIPQSIKRDGWLQTEKTLEPFRVGIGWFLVFGIFNLLGAKYDQRIRLLIAISFVAFLTLAASWMASYQLPFRYPFDLIWTIFGCTGIYSIIKFIKNYGLKFI